VFERRVVHEAGKQHSAMIINALITSLFHMNMIPTSSSTATATTSKRRRRRGSSSSSSYDDGVEDYATVSCDLRDHDDDGISTTTTNSSSSGSSSINPPKPLRHGEASSAVHESLCDLYHYPFASSVLVVSHSITSLTTHLDDDDDDQ